MIPASMSLGFLVLSCTRFAGRNSSRMFSCARPAVEGAHGENRSNGSSQQFPTTLYLHSGSGQNPALYPRLAYMEDMCSDVKKWQEILRRRGQSNDKYSHIDLPGLCDQWRKIKELNRQIRPLWSDMKGLQRKRLACLAEEGADSNVMVEQLDRDIAELTGKIRELEPEWKVVEKELAEKVVVIPNSISADTPEHTAVVYESGGCLSSGGSLQRQERMSHQHICQLHKLTHSSPLTAHICYKTGVLSQLEHAIECGLYDKLRRRGYTPLSTPHLYTSPILEAAHMELEPSSVWSVEKSHLERSQQPYHSAFHDHLTGVGMPAFTTLLCRRALRQRALPLHLMSCGTTYMPYGATAVPRGTGCVPHDTTSVPRGSSHSGLPSLYTSRQGKVCDVFVADAGGKAVADTRRDLVMLCRSVCEEYLLPVRVLHMSSSELSADCDEWACLVQVWSPHLDAYVTCGHVATHNTYVSERMCMFYTAPGETGHMPLHTYYCRVVDINVLLAVLLEYWQQPIPPQQQHSMPQLPSYVSRLMPVNV